MYALFSKVNHNTLKNIQCFHIKGDLLLIYPEKAFSKPKPKLKTDSSGKPMLKVTNKRLD